MRGANVVLFAARGKLLERELTDCLEQPRSRCRTRLDRALDQAVIDEHRKGIDDTRRAGVTGDRLGRLDRKAACKHSQAGKHRPRATLEQRKTPRDGVTQRALAVGQVDATRPRAARTDAQAVRRSQRATAA